MRNITYKSNIREYSEITDKTKGAKMQIHNESLRPSSGPEGITLYHRVVDAVGSVASATAVIVKGIPDVLRPSTTILNPKNKLGGL